MRRYLYSNLIKIIFGTFLVIVLISSVVYFACSLLIDKSLNKASLTLVLSCLLLWFFLDLVIFILNKTASNSIVFDEGKILYKNRTIYCNNVNIKYFKFYVSLIEPNLVIPKTHMNGNNFSLTCYLSRKDIRKLKNMNFDITEI